jgi:predicted transcriptional regulator
MICEVQRRVAMRYALFLFLLVAGAAVAAPPAAVDFSLPTTADLTRSASELRGKVAVFFYEDRHSTETNALLKKALRRAALEDRSFGERLAVVPIANVSGYDFWPARYFARNAVKKMARRHDLEIWLDWKGALQPMLGLRDDTSNVVVLDRAGRLRVRRFGPIPSEELGAFLQQLRALMREGAPGDSHHAP